MEFHMSHVTRRDDLTLVFSDTSCVGSFPRRYDGWEAGQAVEVGV